MILAFGDFQGRLLLVSGSITDPTNRHLKEREGLSKDLRKDDDMDFLLMRNVKVCVIVV